MAQQPPREGARLGGRGDLRDEIGQRGQKLRIVLQGGHDDSSHRNRRLTEEQVPTRKKGGDTGVFEGHRSSRRREKGRKLIGVFAGPVNKYLLRWRKLLILLGVIFGFVTE